MTAAFSGVVFLSVLSGVIVFVYAFAGIIEPAIADAQPEMNFLLFIIKSPPLMSINILFNRRSKKLISL
jgi:ABC-type Na+ efflux pump permease subunit